MGRDDWREFGKDGWGEDGPGAGQGCALAMMFGGAIWLTILVFWLILSR